MFWQGDTYSSEASHLKKTSLLIAEVPGYQHRLRSLPG